MWKFSIKDSFRRMEELGRLSRPSISYSDVGSEASPRGGSIHLDTQIAFKIFSGDFDQVDQGLVYLWGRDISEYSQEPLMGAELGLWISRYISVKSWRRMREGACMYKHTHATQVLNQRGGRGSKEVQRRTLSPSCSCYSTHTDNHTHIIKGIR